MPPKVKTDREAILCAAFEVAKCEGMATAETIMLPCLIDIGERMTGSLSFMVNSISTQSGLDFESSKTFFLNMCIYTHGIASLVYKGSLVMSEDEEQKLLTTTYEVFLSSYKSTKS